MLTCNDCGRDINDCDRYGCREIRGTTWHSNPMACDCRCNSDIQEPNPACPVHGQPNAGVNSRD